jgi:toxin ParE1/3/4
MVAILTCSEQEFGSAARDRYAALLFQAMRDVAHDPARPGATLDRAIDPTCRFYHIRHGRARVPNPPGRVGEPRHVLIDEIADDGTVDIIAIVPDPVPREVAVARIRRRATIAHRRPTRS